jgi:hypothetical protein
LNRAIRRGPPTHYTTPPDAQRAMPACMFLVVNHEDYLLIKSTNIF